MRRVESEVGPDARLDVRLESGDLTVTVGEPGRIVVDLTGPGAEDAEVDASVHGVNVRAPIGQGRFARRRVDVRAVVPPDLRLTASSASGDVLVTGAVAEVTATTASGDLRVDDVGRLSVKTASGDVLAGTVSSSADVAVASGDVRIASSWQRLDCVAASGDVAIGEARGVVRVRSASGNVTIDRMLDGQVEVRTMSGDTIVGIPPRRRVHYDLHALGGSTFLPDDTAPAPTGAPEGTVRIAVKAVSGNLHLRRVD